MSLLLWYSASASASAAMLSLRCMHLLGVQFLVLVNAFSCDVMQPIAHYLSPLPVLVLMCCLLHVSWSAYCLLSRTRDVCSCLIVWTQASKALI